MIDYRAASEPGDIPLATRPGEQMHVVACEIFDAIHDPATRLYEKEKVEAQDND